MWTLTYHDLKFRRRRFVIAIAGTALVFAMALVMSGMSAGFRVEVDRTLAAIGADAWVVPDGVPGPFTAFRTIPAETVAAVEEQASVQRAFGMVVLRHTVERDGGHDDVNLLGLPAAALDRLALAQGAVYARPGEAVVDQKLGLSPGDRFVVQGAELTVSGVADSLTFLGGIPVVLVSLDDAQRLAFAGRPFVSTIVTRGVPSEAPDGMQVLAGNDAVKDDMLRPLLNGVQTIDSTRMLLWLVAATIIGAIVYLSALERVRDFAVLKAIGASNRALYLSLVAQAVLVSLLAAVIAAGVAALLAPAFPLPVVIPASAYAALPLVALGVGALASLSGLGRIVRVDPARAFGGA